MNLSPQNGISISSAVLHGLPVYNRHTDTQTHPVTTPRQDMPSNSPHLAVVLTMRSNNKVSRGPPMAVGRGHTVQPPREDGRITALLYAHTVGL